MAVVFVIEKVSLNEKKIFILSNSSFEDCCLLDYDTM